MSQRLQLQRGRGIIEHESGKLFQAAKTLARSIRRSIENTIGVAGFGVRHQCFSLIGDSISIGYMLAAGQALSGEGHVLRPTTNCEPTTRGLESLERWLGDRKWDVIHFNFGVPGQDLGRADVGQLVGGKLRHNTIGLGRNMMSGSHLSHKRSLP